MRTSRSLIAAFTLWVASSASAGASFQAIDFPAADGLEVRADLYETHDKAGTLIVLFHQAGWSRGEYREIAPKLVALGYRVMAVDQRSGGAINGVRNETARRAAAKRRKRSYLDAYPDLEAALKFAKTKLKASRVVVWGSSYSASLVFRLAAEHPSEVDAVLAFAPGEYFKKAEGPEYVRGFALKVNQPLFVTSSKQERAQVEPIFKASPSKKKILFTPASKGQHGSRALWDKWPDSDVYWSSVLGFLREYAPPRNPG